jgi:hypothetical protein
MIMKQDMKIYCKTLLIFVFFGFRTETRRIWSFPQTHAVRAHCIFTNNLVKRKDNIIRRG